MSLINDALKRAKAAQRDAPPQANCGPALRPVEPDNVVRRSVGLVLPLVLAAIALLILFFVWRYAPPTRKASPQAAPVDISTARARTLPSSNKPSVGASVVITPPAQESPKTAATSAASPQPAAANPSIQQSNNPATASPGAGIAEAAAVTNTAGSMAPTNTPPAKPALPKLQGIVFNPRRPSAVINGKTLFLGDRVAGFRVVAIGPDSATLVSGGQTNVLMLEE